MKKMKLGLHTYTLHLWGLGENWANYNEPRPKEMTLMELIDNAVKWGLDGLHITGCDLETKDDKRLEEVKEAMQKRDLYVEYNFSLDSEFDTRINDSVEDGVLIAHKLGADLAKISLDIRRPTPLYGSRFHPQVMRQLVDIYEEVKAALPLVEEKGVKLALENHTETYADEVLWLIDQIDHPMVGACLDTVNSMCVLEDPVDAVEKLAPYAFCIHFCDHKLTRDEFGLRFHGVALGDGDIDCLKVYKTIRDVSPTERINFEIEWDMGTDSLQVAQQKQLEACLKSIKYAREVIGIGK